MAPAEEQRAAIEAMGREIGPAMMRGVHILYGPDQLVIARDIRASAVDLAYGPDPRHRLDLYCPDGDDLAPILVWVHGGGFRRGAKSEPDHPFEAHFGRFAARHGHLGVVMNYRLTPDHVFPSGGEDVGLVVDWLKAHAAEHGGDPHRIVLVGTSAGAAHVATYLMLRPNASEVGGAVFLSGLYGVAPYDDERDVSYYGADASRHPAMAPLDALATTDVPLLVVCAEFDPPRFQKEFAGLLGSVLAKQDRLPLAFVAAGHNHFR